MNAPALLKKLRAAGVKIERRGRDLWLEPRTAITPELTSALRVHKAELLAQLDAEQEPDPNTVLVSVAYLLSAHECRGCIHNDSELLVGRKGRRQWLPVCAKGHRILKAGYGAENLEIAPPECDSYERPGLSGPGVYH
jgi:hypothetical protein